MSGEHTQSRADIMKNPSPHSIFSRARVVREHAEWRDGLFIPTMSAKNKEKRIEEGKSDSLPVALSNS